MAQSRMRLSGEARSPEDIDFMQFGAIKMVYMEQVSQDVWICTFASEFSMNAVSI